MKKIYHILPALLLVISLVSCSKAEGKKQGENNNEYADGTGIVEIGKDEKPETLPQSEDKATSGNEKQGKILIAYFTWAENTVTSDVDAVTSASVKAPGNVAMLASWIAEETQGELFAIKVTEPYPADWDECLSRANQEKTDGIHPELLQTVSNIDEYDVMFLGYPNWWYSCPMAILSFIEENQLSDKEIYLFCSHGTGGLARSVQDISAALPESAIISDNVFDVYEDDVASAKEDLLSWLDKLKEE